MKRTYTYEIIWRASNGPQRKVIKTFTNQKTKRTAENWMWNYIKGNGCFANEFILKKTAEA